MVEIMLTSENAKEANARENLVGITSVRTFKDFEGQFHNELSSRHFGDDEDSVVEWSDKGKYSKSPGARELERPGVKDVLLNPAFLRFAHHSMREYCRLMKEQKKVRSVSAESGKSIKKLADAQKTLVTLRKRIEELYHRWDGTLRLEILEHLVEAMKELQIVEDAFYRAESSQISDVHPAIRSKHEKYKRPVWKPLTQKFEYELPSLKKKAPQQWLWRTLDSGLQRRFSRTDTKVTDATRYRIMSAVLASGGLERPSPRTIKEYFADAKSAKQPIAKNL